MTIPVTLYAAPQTRSRTALWLLEELGHPYTVKFIDVRAGAQKTFDYLAVNPMGKVPALVDGPVKVAESAAICLYLADRYGGGRLAPALDAPDRGDFLRWMFFAGSCIEPAMAQKAFKMEAPATALGWGSFEQVTGVLEQALAGKDFLLGRFTAAEVAAGSGVLYGIAFKLIEPTPVLQAYAARLTSRPAYQKALAVEAGMAG